MKKDFFKEGSLKGKKKVHESKFTSEALNELREDEVLIIEPKYVKRKGDKLKKGGFLKADKTLSPDISVKEAVNRLQDLKQDNNFIYGYGFEPVNLNDKRIRTIGFYSLYESLNMLIYSELYKSKFKKPEDKGIRIINSFGDAPQVKNEGLMVRVGVPSTSKNKPQYKITFKHFPVSGKNLWDYTSKFKNEPEDMHFSDMKYGRDDIIIHGSEVAGYTYLLREFHTPKNDLFNKANLFPLMNKKGYEISSKLERIVLKGIGRSPKFVRSLMLSRYLGEYGYDSIFGWSKNDGKIVNYKKA